MSLISILTTSDFPYGGAPENFVREMTNGITNSSNNIKIEVSRFWGERYIYKNDTDIKCTNFLLKRPIKNEFLKFFELLLQVLYVPVYVIRKIIFDKTKVFLLYGVDRAYIILPFLILSKIFKVKTFRVITEIYRNEDFAYTWWRKPLIFFYNFQLKYLDRHLNGIIVLSTFLKDNCMKNGVKENNICLIPHFINFDNFIINNSNSFQTDSFNLVYSGTISAENGIQDLVDAFLMFRSKYKIKNTKLTILGRQNYNLFSERNQIQLRESNIHFTGNLKKEDVFIITSQASVLMNPRRKTILADSGFPTKIGEYFATKVPILSTSTGDLIKYFTHGKELYFSPPNDPHAMTEMIFYIYKNENERLLVGERGYLWGKENLDSYKNAQKLLYFIDKV